MRHLPLAVALTLSALACAEPQTGAEAAAPRGATAEPTDDDGVATLSADASETAGAAPDEAVSEPTPLAARRLDPACVDGRVTLDIPGRQPSIAAEVAAYEPARARALMRQVLTARWPYGERLVDEGVALAGPDEPDCVTRGLNGDPPALARDFLLRLQSVVHECGHAVDLAAGDPLAPAYRLGPDTVVRCEGGRYVGPLATPARSRIRGDAFGAERPPCPDKGERGCDPYAGLYLEGDPGDDQFDTGDQGLAMVLEELLQYQHSLMAARTISDHLIARTSARDGLLTSLWYLERYLHMMRLGHPEAYAAVMESPCWRGLILTLWGRSWRLLEATADERHLGLEDEALLALVEEPALLQEIERVRRAHGCD